MLTDFWVKLLERFLKKKTEETGWGRQGKGLEWSEEKEHVNQQKKVELAHRHINKEALAEEPYEESTHFDASLKRIYINAYYMTNKQKACVITAGPWPH